MLPLLPLLLGCDTPSPPPPVDPPPVAILAQVEPAVAVPVACVLPGGVVKGGADCVPHLTDQLSILPGGTARLAGRTNARCPATDAAAAGLLISSIDPGGSGQRWGHVGALEGWIAPAAVTLDAAEAAAAVAVLADGSGWPLQAGADGVVVQRILTLNRQHLIRAQGPITDPEKPPRSAVLVQSAAGFAPLSAEGLDLNGAITITGALPLEGGGHLVVLTSQWMGGSGLHAVQVDGEGSAAVGEWVCGS